MASMVGGTGKKRTSCWTHFHTSRSEKSRLPELVWAMEASLKSRLCSEKSNE